jgi:hypothetical protein
MDAAALGFLIGRAVVDKVPVLSHWPFSQVELKNMGAAMAASGGVALFHVEGLTPEAPDMTAAFLGGAPERTITITQADLDGVRAARGAACDMVAFGCPQMTYDEAVAIAGRFAGRRANKRVMFCVLPSDRMRFDESEAGRRARAAGVEVHEHCPLAALSIRPGVKTVLTNSGKLYYYLAGTAYGTTEDCLSACGVA